MIGAGLGYIDTPREPQHCLPTIIEAGYLCLHPGCELIFGDDLALEDHMKTHFDQPELPAARAAVDHAATGLHQPLLASVRLIRVGLFKKCPIEDCSAHRSYWIREVEAHRRTHFLRGDKYMCQIASCGSGFTRWGDLLRHEKKHLPDAPKLDCPEIGCEYKGSRGFARRDKLMDHRRNRHGLAAAPRAHRRKVQKSAVGCPLRRSLLEGWEIMVSLSSAARQLLNAD